MNRLRKKKVNDR